MKSLPDRMESEIISPPIEEVRELLRRVEVAEQALYILARLGNAPHLGNSIGNQIAQRALEEMQSALPTSA